MSYKFIKCLVYAFLMTWRTDSSTCLSFHTLTKASVGHQLCCFQEIFSSALLMCISGLLHIKKNTSNSSAADFLLFFLLLLLCSSFLYVLVDSSTSHPYMHVEDAFRGLMYGPCRFLLCLIQLFKVQSLHVKLHAFSPSFSLPCSFVPFICLCIERLQRCFSSMSVNQSAGQAAKTSHYQSYKHLANQCIPFETSLHYSLRILFKIVRTYYTFKNICLLSIYIEMYCFL